MRNFKLRGTTIQDLPVSKFYPDWEIQIEKLTEKWGDVIEDIQWPGKSPTDVPIVFIKAGAIREVLAFLKNTDGFLYDFLSDLTVTDELEEDSEHRFHIVYQLFSYQHFWRLRLKTKLKENQEALSIASIWPAADWLEREAFDMFGVKFSGHPDLRKILMDERFEGNPLRKDYPLRGYQLFVEPMLPERKVLESK